MVDVAKFFLEFTQRESCGKCGPCREGTKQMLDAQCDKQGRGHFGRSNKPEKLAQMVKEMSLRSRSDGPKPRFDHPSLFQTRIRGTHLREALPGQGLRRAHPLHDRSRVLS